MPVIILLVIIILLILFGPWLLVAIGLVLAFLLAAVVWIITHIIIPLLIFAGILLAIAAGCAVLYYAFKSGKALLDKR